jgi:protein-S-isoprenylcysteine O-methyltransferase Ste14
LISGLTLAFVLSAAWLPIFYWRAEETSKALPSYGFWERFWVIVAPSVVGLHVTSSCAVLSWVPRVSAGRVLASLALCGGGVAIYLWARRAIGPMRVRRLPDEPPTRLRRDGAFGMVRNPLYFGTLLAAAAPALAAARPYLAATYFACVAALFIRSVQEERRLHAQLGEEYASYCREVKRLVPFVW